MKAERRHELKTNTLAHGLEGLPEFGRRYGTKVLLAIVAVLAIVLFVRFQARDARQRAEGAAEAFAGARAGINNLRNVAFMPDGKAAAEQRRELVSQSSLAIQQVLDDSKDDALRAEALVARGDLNWTLATGPEVSGADTQPSLKLQETDDELLDRAKAAYEQAAQTAGASPLTVATARLGLAAVAEQRKQWDEARKQYEQMAADARIPDAFKTEAQIRLEDLAALAQPVFIGKPATAPSTEATTSTAPSTAPTDEPTTATSPSTTPTTDPQPEPPVEKPAAEPAPERPEPAAGAEPTPAAEPAAPAAEPAPTAEPAPSAEPAPAPAPEPAGEAKQ